MGKDQEGPSNFKVTDRRGQAKEEPIVIPSEPPPQNEAPGPTPRSPGPVDFASFLLSLSSSALIHMGIVNDPETKKTNKNLALARQELDILGMLQEKTRGNLSPDEQKILTGALYELRLRFVEVSKG